MINVITNEYREGDLAVKTVVVTFLYIPIFKKTETSTNSAAVIALTGITKPTKVNGFKYETRNKSKKDK